MSKIFRIIVFFDLILHPLNCSFQEIFWFFVKIIARTIEFNKMNNGSVIPNVEFKIILGSKINKDPPITANFSETKFLHR